MPNLPYNNMASNQAELLDKIVDMFNNDVFINGSNSQLKLSIIDDDKYALTFNDSKSPEPSEPKTTEGSFESIVSLLANIKSKLYNVDSINFGETLASLTPELKSVFDKKLEVKSDKFDFQNPTFKLKLDNKILLTNFPENQLVKVLNNLIYIFKN